MTFKCSLTQSHMLTLPRRIFLWYFIELLTLLRRPILSGKTKQPEMSSFIEKGCDTITFEFDSAILLYHL